MASRDVPEGRLEHGRPRGDGDQKHAGAPVDESPAAAGQPVAEFADELRIGVGLNSGSVVAGNIGGGGRFDFSVIGDVVTVAARVEVATRQTGDTILIADPTRRLLRGSDVALEERPNVPLKGKREAVKLYGLSRDVMR